MGIQDDIFDVEHSLEGKPEAESFDKIHAYIGRLETELEEYRAFYNSAVDLKLAIDKLSKKKSKK